MEHRTDWNRLARYLAGECSPAEARAVEAWLRGDPSRLAFLASLKRTWIASEEAPAAVSTAETEADWARLVQEIRLREEADQGAPHRDRAAARLARRRRRSCCS